MLSKAEGKGLKETLANTRLNTVQNSQAHANNCCRERMSSKKEVLNLNIQ